MSESAPSASQILDVLMGREHPFRFWREMRARLHTEALPRLFKLETDLLTFGFTLNTLRRAGARSVPAVQIGDSPLPSNPTGDWLSNSGDETAVKLRHLWSVVLQGEDIAAVSKPDAVTSMPIEAAAQVFSDGLSVSLAAAAAASTTLIHFKVHSLSHGYRVHSTEHYWYSPIVFGSCNTSPVSGYLTSSNYRFGGDKGGGIIWDYGIHSVSTSNTSTTVTRF